MKKIISILLSVTVLFSTIAFGNLTALAECYHSNGDMGEYIETDYGFAQICPDCGEESIKYIHYEHNNFSAPYKIDLSEYNENKYLSPNVILSITPETDISLKITEASASRNNYYLLLNCTYDMILQGFAYGDEEALAEVQEGLISAFECYELPQTVNLSKNETYCLFVNSGNGIPHGIIQLIDINAKAEIKTSGDWQYNTFGTILKYLGKDVDVVVPSDIDGTDITEISETAFDGNVEYSTIKIESTAVRDFSFLANCKYVHEIYTHNNVDINVPDGTSDNYGSFCSLCNETSIPTDDLVTDCTLRAWSGKCTICGYQGYMYRNDNHDYSVFMEHIDGIEGQEEGDLYRCAYCQKTKLLNANHNYVYKETVKHTCTQDGYDVYECQGCGDIENRPNGDKAQHNYFLAYWDGEGEHYYCNNCTESKTEEHNYKITVIPPTETQHGYTEYECETCYYSYRSNEFDTLGHNYVKIEIVAPNCEKKGYSVYECTNCGDTYLDDFKEPLKHNYVKTVTPATCTNDEIVIYTCARCDDYYIGESNQKAYGHNFKDKIYPVENENYNYIESICTRCGQPEDYPYRDGFEEELYEVKDISYPLNICGSYGWKHYVGISPNTGNEVEFYQKIYSEYKRHNFNSKSFSPTCTEYGGIKYTCNYCGVEWKTGDSQDEADWIFDDDGDGTYKDIICDNDKYGEIFGAPKGHCLTSEIIPATETTKGYTKYFCKDCGEILGCNENYTPELKWNTLDSYKDATQDNVVIFQDQNEDLYLMAWNDDDVCNMSYKKNDDGTINFEIFSDTTCEKIDWVEYGKWNDEFDSNIDSDEYSEWDKAEEKDNISREKLSTAFLYKFSTEKDCWELVNDVWQEDTRFTKTITKDYYFDNPGRNITDKIISNRFVGCSTFDKNKWIYLSAEETEYCHKQLKVSVPQLYDVKFDNIKADDINDIILWFKGETDVNDTLTFWEYSMLDFNDNDEAWCKKELEKESQDFQNHVNNCELCQRIFELHEKLFTEDSLIIYNQDASNNYQFTLLNQYIPEFNKMYEEYYKLLKSDKFNDELHYTIDTTNLGQMFWSPNASTRQFTAIPDMVKNPKPADVTVNYVDENGNPLARSEKIAGHGYDVYKTEAKEINNYTLLSVPKNANGRMLRPHTVVEYVYEPKQETTEETKPPEKPFETEPTSKQAETTTEIVTELTSKTELITESFVEPTAEPETNPIPSSKEKAEKVITEKNEPVPKTGTSVFTVVFIIVAVIVCYCIVKFGKKEEKENKK